MYGTRARSFEYLSHIDGPGVEDCVLLQESIWLIAPLIAKLPANVQGKVLKAAGDKLKTGNNFWTAKNAVEKELYIQER